MQVEQEKIKVVQIMPDSKYAGEIASVIAESILNPSTENTIIIGICSGMTTTGSFGLHGV